VKETFVIISTHARFGIKSFETHAATPVMYGVILSTLSRIPFSVIYLKNRPCGSKRVF
jgi:hypothetical protein